MSWRFILSMAISIAVAVLGGFISSYVFDLSGTDSFLAGLMLLVISELCIQLWDFDQLRATTIAVLQFARTISIDDRFSNFYVVLLLARVRSSARDLNENGIMIRKEDVQQIWTECVAHADSELSATSYVNPDVWWSMEYAEPSSELRKAMARQNKKVRTLFLWDQQSELSRLKPIAEDLQSAGVTATHTSLESIKSDYLRNSKLKTIKTPDFAIIDGRWAFLHFLDRSRKTKYAFLTSDPKIVDACRQLLNTTPGKLDFNPQLDRKPSGNFPKSMQGPIQPAEPAGAIRGPTSKKR